MFRAMLLKEFRHHLLSFRFVISAALFLVVTATGLFVIGGRHRRDLAAYSMEQAKWRQQASSSSSLRDLGMLGLTIARRPVPESVLGRGLEDRVPRTVRISVYSDPSGTANRYVNPVFFLFQAPDLLNMVKIVGTLLALFFVFDTVCGEKEAGTLRLIMVHPIRRHTVLLGKCAGAYLALLVPFALSMLVAVAVMQLRPDLRPDAEGWGRIAAFGFAVSLVLAAFFALGLWVSTMNRRSSTSLVVSVLAWVVLVLALPNLAPVMTRPFVEVPSESEIAEEKRAVRDELRRERWRAERDAANEDERDRIADQYEERIQNAVGAIEGRRKRMIDTHVAYARAVSRLSPAACFTYAATAILGTGIDEYGQFVESVNRFNVELSRYYRLKEREMSRAARDGGGRWEAPFDAGDLPQFDYRRAPLPVALARATFDLLLLALAFAVFFLAAWAAFLRYDVR